MNRNDIISNLQEGICTVVFTKANGDERVMNCTLMDEYLPETQSKGESKVNESVVNCFDVEANGWRSFRVDSVIQFLPCCDTTEFKES